MVIRNTPSPHECPLNMTEPKPNGMCLHCNGPIKKGVAQLSSGALALDELLQNSGAIEDHRHIAFMYVHYHGIRPDMSDCACVDVVADVPGGQFDLSFCSLTCMRAWFNAIVDRLECDLGNTRE